MSFLVCLAHMSLDRKGAIHFLVFSKAKGPGDPLDYIAATETSSPLQERQRFQRRVLALQNYEGYSSERRDCFLVISFLQVKEYFHLFRDMVSCENVLTVEW